MCENNVTGCAVKIVLQPFRQVLVWKMAATRCDALFQAQAINTACTQHIAAVVRFDKNRITTPQLLTDQSSDMSKICQCGDPHTVAFGKKPEIIHRVMRHGERLEIDIANTKVSI